MNFKVGSDTEVLIAPEVYIIARDRKAGYILKGGLGFQGLGQMWHKDLEPYNKDMPGYDNAPEQEYK